MPAFRCFLAGVILALIGSIAAGEPVQQQNSNAVWFENWIGLSNATMTVVAPNGEVTQLFAAQGTPVFQLAARDVQDGIYRYELTASTEEKVKVINQVNSGRGDNSRDTMSKAYAMSGFFTVSRGVVIRPQILSEGTASGQDN